MRYLTFLVIVVLAIGISGCSKKASEDRSASKVSGTESNRPLTAAEIQAVIDKAQATPLVDVADDEVGLIETDSGRIVLELFPKVAPHHCRSFKRLATSGFYDGTTFHRVIPGFMIQGGDIFSRDDDPGNDGTGGPGYNLPAEFSKLHHERGTLSMARRGDDINSAGSQFFICVAPAPHLDGQYTIWGRVLEGMDVVDKIVAAAGTDPMKQNPDNPVVMKKVRVVKRNEL
ncbi:MAG: peptidylprolyl isomerase [candidate division KSB1 bacterium]|nr:peptidylprolyl isomerase [candidate division KSB1 bacterium]MDZ7300846.1 peptidylprolyl isomerase [candidate division KSB1 bacterium]MDZ7309883.1 peptidylprolyl isomerase [candidate division KSB1 bacterium]